MEEEAPVIRGRGGYRPGAGRPKGRKNIVGLKKAVLDYTSPEELKNMVDRAKRMAKTDKTVLMWYLEQVFGKPKVANTKPAAPTNIALFLNALEQKQNGSVGHLAQPIVISPDRLVDDDGRAALEQELETGAPLSDYRQEG